MYIFADCGGKIIGGPGEIVKVRYEGQKSEKCTWTIQAPIDCHVYIYFLRYRGDAYENLLPLDPYIKVPELRIYDGLETLESNLLFRCVEMKKKSSE